MFNLLCCKATEISDKTTELAGIGHDKLKGAADGFTQTQLREAFVGQATRVHEAPEVVVTVTDVALQEGGGLSSVRSFRIKGLACKVEIGVQGTAAQMAGMVAAGHAGSLFGLLAQGEKALTGALGIGHAGLAETVASKAAEAKSELVGAAAAGQERKTLNLEVIVDLEKVVGVEQVTAKVVAVTSSHDAVNKVISLSVVEKYVETAVSRQVSQAVTDWQKSSLTLANARERGGDLVTTGVAKGGDLIDVARSKASEWRANAIF